MPSDGQHLIRASDGKFLLDTQGRRLVHADNQPPCCQQTGGGCVCTPPAQVRVTISGYQFGANCECSGIPLVCSAFRWTNIVGPNGTRILNATSTGQPLYASWGIGPFAGARHESRPGNPLVCVYDDILDVQFRLIVELFQSLTGDCLLLVRVQSEAPVVAQTVTRSKTLRTCSSTFVESFPAIGGACPPAFVTCTANMAITVSAVTGGGGPG